MSERQREIGQYATINGKQQAAEKFGVAYSTVDRAERAYRNGSYARTKPKVSESARQPYLLFSDTHAPYHHKKALSFLSYVHKAYNCRKRIYCLGDLMDFHSMSRHTTELDSPSPSEEYRKALEFTSELCKLFPEGELVLGNHDCIPQRQLATINVAIDLLKSHNDLYGLTSGWKVHPLYTTIKANGLDMLLDHGNGSLGKTGARNTAILKRSAYAQGHAHSFAGVQYSANFNSLIFGANTGCLCDNSSLAMRYAKYAKEKGVLGCTLVYGATEHIAAHAVFVPMNA